MTDKSAAGAWAMLAIVSVFGATVSAALGLVGTEWLLDQLLSLEKNADNARYTAESLSRVQSRFLLVSPLFLLLAAAWVTVGPLWLAREIRGLWAILRSQLAMPRSHAFTLLALSAVFALFAGLHLNQQMRSDESSSFVMYAQTTPLVALLTYEVPNNHILHSALMWISVRLFGVDEWAVRLPAFLVSLTLPALLFAAGRAWIGPATGLLASAVLVGSAYAIDVATNARGYPILLACMLCLLALGPAIRSRAPGAWLGAILAGAAGVYAVPVMAYPLGIAYLAMLLAGPTPDSPSNGRWLARHTMHLMRLCALGCLTLAAAAMFYLPAWVLRTGGGPVAAIENVEADVAAPQALTDWNELSYNLNAAFAQCIWPLPESMGLVAGLLLIAGLVVCLLRSRDAAAFAIASGTAPVVVFVGTGFLVPPWWTLVWLFPLIAILAVQPLAAVLRQRPGTAALAVPVLAGAMITATALAGYPRGFPYWVGYRDAPEAAVQLNEVGYDDAHVIAHGGIYRDIAYQVVKRGHWNHPLRQTASLHEPSLPRVIHIRADEVTMPFYADPLSERLKGKLELVRTTTFGDSYIDEYLCRKQVP